MSSKPIHAVHVARLLNSTKQIGIEDPGMMDFINDYFGDPAPEGAVSSDESELDSSSSDESNNEFPEVTIASDDHLVEPRLKIRRFELNDHDKSDDGQPTWPPADGIQLPAQEPDDVEEEEQAVQLADDKRVNHCHCSLFNGRRCVEQLNVSEQEDIRLNMQEMTPYEKDLFLLGVISSSLNDSLKTLNTKRAQQSARQVTRMRSFYIGHQRICRDTFLYLMQISKFKLTKLKEHYKKNGLVPRKKLSGGRKNNTKSIHLDDIRMMVRFVLNFVEENAISLPGRIPGIHRDDVKVIPSNFTKADIWRKYRDSAENGQKVMAQSTFRKLWKKVLSYVVVAKPASDLCQTCQDNNYLIVRNVNVDEDSKTETLRLQELHLTNATRERSFYRNWCNEAKDVKKELSLEPLGTCLNLPCSRDVAFHYSFDFAQQVHYPSNPFQPGPIYFKTPRKCQIFGVNAEGFPAQVNYLIDEAVACGKGANIVISMVHHFLEKYGIGEHHLRLNSDNCSGQNKNNAMLQYLCWRTLVGLHKSVYIHFLLAGHTKFAPDWCFGLFKQKFRKSFVSSLDEIATSVRESTSISKINVPQLVGGQTGDAIVLMYDWDKFLGNYFKKFVGVKEVQHFWFNCEEPGVLFYRKMSNTEVKSANLLKLQVNAEDRPDVIVPTGLTDTRKAYLYKEIREFCKEGTKDLVCPNPDDEMDRRC